VSLIRLLIASSGYEENEVDASALKRFDIEVQFVERERLMALTSIDFDVVLLDDCPGLDNVVLIDRLRTIVSACRVVVVIRQSAQAVSYLQVGATGLLDSFHEPARLADIIRCLCQGEYYLDKQIAQLLAMRHI